MSQLIESAKKRARQEVGELTGPDDDIMPMVVFEGPHGLGLMPCGPLMESDATKDELALWMTASLAVAQATEAVFISTAYMAAVEFDDPTVDVLAGRTTIAAKDRPNAIEAVVLQFCDHKTSGCISAELGRRRGKPPTLGEWSEPFPEMGGRFGNALYLGLKVVREMPPEMAAIIEAGWADGSQADLIERFVKVARAFSHAPTPPQPSGIPTSFQVPPPEAEPSAPKEGTTE